MSGVNGLGEKCPCGARIDQATNGLGRVVDVCSRSGRAPIKCVPGVRADISAPPPARQCVECAREFTWEPKPGGGRPPTRCPSCRGDDAKRASSAPAPAAKTKAVAVVRKAPPPAPVTISPVASIDIRAIRKQLGEEVSQFERQIGARLQLLRALDQYLETSARA